MWITYFLLLVIPMQCVSPAMILLLSHLQGSHVAELSNIAVELIARNHTVYTVLPSVTDNVRILSKKGIKVIEFEPKPGDVFMDSEEYNHEVSVTALTDRSITEVYEQIVSSGAVASTHCKGILDNPKIMSQLQSLKFDLAVVDAFSLNYCLLIVPQLINVQFVSVFSTMPHWVMGVPALASFVPSIFQNANDKMTFSEKLVSALWHVFLNSGFNPIISGNDLIQKYTPEFGSWTNLLKSTELYFKLRDEILERPEPLMPNTIALPGMTYDDVKPLPVELEKVFSKAKKGVIIVSFGSTAGYMPSDMLIKFFEAFRQMPDFEIVWKFPLKKLGTQDVPSNVHMFEVIPQNDCLGHNKTKLFITHCGNNGQYESIFHAVPMLGFPLFAEQPHNSFRMQDRGYGLQMSIKSFTTKELVNNMNEILNNAVFSENVRHASTIMKSQPHPKETDAFWIEHVIKFGGSHLRGASMDMPWYQLLMVDILLLFLVIVVTIIFIFYCVVRKCCGRFQKVKTE